MAVFLMLISVIIWSFYPIIAAFGIEKINIWEFLLWSELITLISSYFCLAVIGKKTKQKPRKISEYSKKHNIKAMYTIATFIISQFCLLSSFFFISKAAATIAFESWPIFAIYLAPLMIKKAWDNVRIRDYVYAVIALFGVFLVMYPEISGKILIGDGSGEWGYMAILLPLIGGFFMAISSVLKASLSNEVSDNEKPIMSLFSVQILTKIYSLPILLICVLLFSDWNSVYDFQNIVALLLAGIVVQNIGSVLYTWSLLITKKASISVIWYFMPIFSAIWFWITGISEITDFIVVGAMTIISCNLLISIKADNTIAYVITLFSILFVGMYCYFVPGIELGDIYYEAISVPIVFFVVIGAFIMDRLITRDTLEEELGLNIINRVLYSKDVLSAKSHKLIMNVCEIMKNNNPVEINRLYSNSVDNNNDEEISTNLDKLVLSKLHSTNFGDLFVTSIVGLLIAGVTILYRPNNLIGDLFAIILTSSVAFMFFTLVDLNNERKDFHIEIDKKGNKKLSDIAVTDKKTDVIISVIVILILSVSFTGLLWVKYH